MAQSARPAVGRTTCAEILHGGRSKKLLRNSYDGLPAYGSSSHMRRADIVARVDELIEAGPPRDDRAAATRCCAGWPTPRPFDDRLTVTAASASPS